MLWLCFVEVLLTGVDSVEGDLCCFPWDLLRDDCRLLFLMIAFKCCILHDCNSVYASFVFVIITCVCV